MTDDAGGRWRLRCRRSPGVHQQHLQQHAEERRGRWQGQWFLALPAAAALLGVLLKVLLVNPWRAATAQAPPTTGIIGHQLLTTYMLPFELVSVLLLVAMVGAIVLAKEDKPDDPA